MIHHYAYEKNGKMSEVWEIVLHHQKQGKMFQ